MVRTYVLRLMAEPLADGRVVGELETIESGERVPVRDAAGLLARLTGRPQPVQPTEVGSEP